MSKFIEKFQEVKEAASIIQQKGSHQMNGGIVSARDSPRLSSASYQNDVLLGSKRLDSTDWNGLI